LQQTAADVLSAEPQAPPPLADIVLCFSLQAEAVGVLDRLQNPFPEQREVEGQTLAITHGLFAGKNVAVVITGNGVSKTAAACDMLLAERTPQWLISAGFALGLRPGLSRRSFFLPREVVSERGPAIATNLSLDAASLAALKNVHTGRLVSTSSPPKTIAEKSKLAEQMAADVCDLDSWPLLNALPLGEFAGDAPVASLPRRLSVRIISDAVDDEFSPEVEALLKQESWGAKLGAAAGALFRRPSVAKELWDLQNESLVLADRLAKFLAGIVPQLK
jgi:adenosylhomocysteine nucleosidase